MATKAKGKPQTSAPPTYTCAMDKIRDEMAKSKQRYVQIVGEYLTDYLQQHPEAEDKLMAAGKSIEGSLGAMKDEARKHEQGGVGILDDATAFGVVLRYYGIEGDSPSQPTGLTAPSGRGPVGLTSDAPTLQKPSPSGEGGATAPGEVVSPPSASAPAQSVGTPYMASARRGADAAPAPAPDPFDLDALMGGL